MNEVNQWQKFNSSFQKTLKDFSFSDQSKIRQMIYKKSNDVMKRKTLESIYGKNGAQLFEKNTSIFNYVKISSQGSFSINRNSLQKTEQGHDRFNTDFINYGGLPGIQDQHDLKYNMALKSDFESNNIYLYNVQEQRERQDNIVSDGIKEIQIAVDAILDNMFNKKNKKRRDG